MSADASDPIWGSLLLQVLLISINAFFAATEIAVLSLNESKIKRQVDLGDKKAVWMIRMAQSPTKYISTIQVGTMLTGFLASAFAANNFAAKLADALLRAGVTFLSRGSLISVCIILITVVLSYFMLVFGVLVPKRVAMQHAEKVVRGVSGIIRALAVLMHPAVWLLSKSTNLVLGVLGVSTEKKPDIITEEGIRMMVDMGEEKGTIEAGEAEMIENIFEFNNLIAEDVMVHRTDVSAICVTDTREDILTTIRESGFSRFPVYDEDMDDIVGILSTREYLLSGQEQPDMPIRDLIRPAYFVPETVRADALFRDMQKKKTHMAVVVDEYGGTSGIVTLEDLLEEIVGDIYDEFDPQQEMEVERLETNLWRATGSVDLETLGEALEVDLPLDDEFDTLGGLVYSCMTAIPEDGTTPCVEAFGLRVQVEKIEDRRVESALVSKVEPTEE